MPNDPQLTLLPFIRAAKAGGASDESLGAILRDRGWDEAGIRRALRHYYEEATGMAVPERGGDAGNRALEAFIHLAIFISLGVWTFGVGAIFFSLVARHFPDSQPGFYAAPFRAQIAGALAQVIVAAPIYFLLSRYDARDLARNPDKARGSVRRWLTAITLVLAGAVMVGDLVTFVSRFLSGGMTARFMLDVLVVLVLASGVFAYYLPGLIRKREPAGD
jgi:uncharacterized membrane protein YedE/YeeE